MKSFTPDQLRVLRDMQRYASHISHVINNAIKYAEEHPDQTTPANYLDTLSAAAMFGEGIEHLAKNAYNQLNK